MSETEKAPNEAPQPQKVERLAEWAATRKFQHIKEEDIAYLKVLVLDTIGCAIGALGHQPIEAVRSLTDDLGGSTMCTLIGGGRTAADRATFFNGSCVRYLDFMDILMVRGQSFHPSDNFAATLAAAELGSASGRQFLTALATSYQVHASMSERAPLQEKGFDHVTHLASTRSAWIVARARMQSRCAAAQSTRCGSSGRGGFRPGRASRRLKPRWPACT